MGISLTSNRLVLVRPVHTHPYARRVTACVLIGCVHWNLRRPAVALVAAAAAAAVAIKVMYDPILSFILLRTGTS